MERLNLLKRKLYFEILRIRKIEEKLSEIYKYQKIRCPMHLSIGQEAIAVSVSNNLRQNDQIVSNHRNHAHYIARGCSIKKMFAEMYGKKTGSNGGRGGSMNLFSKEKNFILSSPIVGNSIPVGVGLALEKKIKNKKKNLICIYLGDGATEEGVFYESLNFAKLHGLKCLFVIENNYYSVYTPLKYRRKSGIGEVFNLLKVKSFNADGNNVLEADSVIKQAIKYIHKNNQPTMVFLNTYRWLEHCGPNIDDQLNYRPLKEGKTWKKKCPLETLEKKLIKEKIINLNKKSLYLNKIKKEINEAIKFAEKSLFPENNSAKEKIYAK